MVDTACMGEVASLDATEADVVDYGPEDDTASALAGAVAEAASVVLAAVEAPFEVVDQLVAVAVVVVEPVDND